MGFLTNVGAFFLKVKGAVMATTATKVATVVVAATVVTGGTVGAVKAEVFASPETIVENSIDVLVEPPASAAEEVFGLKELFETLTDKGMDLGFGVTLADIPLGDLGIGNVTLPDAGLYLNYRMDFDEKNGSGTVDFKVADTSLLSAQVYVSNKQLQVALPKLYKGNLLLNYDSEEFLQNVQNSALYDMLDEETKAALAEAFASMEQSQKESAEAGKELLKEHGFDFIAKLTALLDGIKAEKAGSGDVTVNGEDIECKIYTATFDAADVEAFLMELLDATEAYVNEIAPAEDGAVTENPVTDLKNEINFAEIQEELKDVLSEVKLTLYRNGKRPIRMELVCRTNNNAEAAITAVFAPKGNPFDNMELDVAIVTEGETEFTCKVQHVTENTADAFDEKWSYTQDGEELFVLATEYDKNDGDIVTKLTAEGTDLFEISGVINNLKVGKEISLELTSIKVYSYEGLVDLGLSAEVYLKPLDGKIALAEGENRDVLTMSAKDWSSFVNEVTKNSYKLILSLIGLAE